MSHMFHKQLSLEKLCLLICVVLGLTCLAASCDFSMGGYKPYPEPPSGKATVSGVIQAVAPVATLKYISADQPQADATGQLNRYPDLGLFLSGYNPPAYSFSSINVPFHSTGERTWEATFTALDLTSGTYTLSEYNQPYADFGVAPYWEQTQVLKTFTVADSAPVTLDPVVYDLGGVEEGNSCTGRILVEGNPIGPIDLQLWMSYDDADYSYLLNEATGTAPNWTFHFNNTLPDRFYYEITNIGPASLSLSASGSNETGGASLRSRFINGLPSLNGELDLTESQSMDLYVHAQANFYTTDWNYNNANQGVINCTVNFTGALDWDSDILLVAEDISGAAASANSSYTRYLLPAGIGLGGEYDLELSWLRAGTYSIDVYRLGEDNSTAPQHIGGLAEPFELELPALQRFEYTEVYYVQPQPYGEVEFDLAIPEGV